MRGSITLCMIAKNEERCIRACLASARESVDEIIVVDTGSTDRTAEAARSFGARVYHYPWDDDFSAPRNVSLEHASGDWILVLDADEMLEPGAAGKIRKLTAVRYASGFLVPILMHPDWTAMSSVRLFRNLSTMRFKGIYHESLTVPESIRSSFPSADMMILHTPLCINDFQRKLQRNIKLLKKHLAHYPGDIYQMLDLARIYLEAGNLVESKNLLHILRNLIEQFKGSRNNHSLYLSHYYAYTLRLMVKQGAPAEEKLDVCKKALANFPRQPLFLHQAGKLWYDLQHYDTASECFIKCIALGESRTYDETMMFPRSLLGSSSYNGIGFCLLRKKCYGPAREWFARSCSESSDARAQQMIQALDMLEKNVSRVNTA